jgi:glycosyltransferase involved in cell wall biosynthesis
MKSHVCDPRPVKGGQQLSDERPSVSVCMAVYNGATHIREQLASILPQLGGDDEIVAVDDASQDASVAIIEGFHDERIRIIRLTENRGVVRAFERASREASGKVIFLSDQDDIWRADKIATMMKAFAADPQVTLVLSNGELIDSNGQSMSQPLHGNGRFLPGVLPNLMKNRYQGSTMAFRREVLEAALPFPGGIPMHDSWIGLVNAVIGRTVYLPDRLVFYRRHQSNVTVGRHGPVGRMFAQRLSLAKNLICRMGALARVRWNLRLLPESTADARTGAKNRGIGERTNSPNRAVVFAPFFSSEGAASRPRFVGSVLAELMAVDIVTSDFDHTRKVKREYRSCSPFAQMICLETRPYHSNVSPGRLISHLLFSFKAAAYFRKNRDTYDVVYATVPLNALTWLVFTQVGAKTTIIDIVDIWPDVLPFTPVVRKALAPVFAVWKWSFTSAVAKADIVMAVSDSFIQEASRYVSDKASVQRFYIGHERLVSAVPKQPIFTIAYVGNLGCLYDFDTLLDVLAEATLRNHVQLFVIGQGDRQEWIVGELERRKLRYRFFGTVFEPARLAETLRSCHVGFNGYINTTAAFSYKATTYFAAGLPIINSMKGDLQCLVKELGLGENYEGGDRKQLSDCFLRFLRNGTTVMAANSERFFASHLDPGKISADMKDFLVTTLDKSRSSCNISTGAGIK